MRTGTRGGILKGRWTPGPAIQKGTEMTNETNARKLALLEGRARRRTEKRAQAIASAAAAYARIAARLARELKELDRQEGADLAHADDNLVFVRSEGGPVVEVYHNAVRPCGMVRSGGFKESLEGEHPRLRRCSKCRWPARRGVAA